MFFNVKRFETFSTFPAIWSDLQQFIPENDSQWRYEEINIKDTDGNNINGLYIPYWDWHGKTIYYFHGNGGPLSYFYSDINYIHSLGYNIMAYDYPGYGKSEWFPYKEKVDEFSKIFYKHVKKEKNIQDEKLIIWWYSIGTAVAASFATENNFERIILVGTLASRHEMSRKIFWFALQKLFFLKDSYDTKTLVKQFKKPALMIHGNNDSIVPLQQWKQVFENYAWKKYFIEIENFWHNGMLRIYGDTLRDYILTFLDWKSLNFPWNYLLINETKTKK